MVGIHRNGINCSLSGSCQYKGTAGSRNCTTYKWIRNKNTVCLTRVTDYMVTMALRKKHNFAGSYFSGT